MNSKISKIMSSTTYWLLATAVVVALWTVSVAIGIHMFPNQMDKSRLQLISYLMTDSEKAKEQEQVANIERLSGQVLSLNLKNQETQDKLDHLEKMTSMEHMGVIADNTRKSIVDTSKQAWGSVTSIFR